MKRTSHQARPARYFFVVMSFVFLIIALIGFIPSYQDMYAGLFPIHWFAHVHGAIMTSWLLVFITQSILAANGRLSFHRQLGMFSVVLGGLVWLSMCIASVRALIGYNPPVDNFLFDVLINQMSGIVLFGTFFICGVIVRKNAAVHKRLLFLATLVLLQAAIDRIRWLPFFGLRGTIAYFSYLDMLIISLFIYDSVAIKRIHTISWMGALLVFLAQFTVITIWGSPVWHRFWFSLLNKFR